MSPPRRAWDIYAAELLERGYGYPMWHPEPGQNGSAPEIGDVGYMHEGRFRRMFNITRPPRSDSEKSYTYHILQYDEAICDCRPDALQAQIVYSHSVSCEQVPTQANNLDASAESSAEPAVYEYTCTGPRGALLLLDQRADSQSVRPNRLFPEYMKKYHKEWMQQAQSKGLDIKKVNIVLVRGAVRTRNWTVAAFHDVQVDQKVSGHVITTDHGLALSDHSRNDSRVEFRSAVETVNGGDIQDDQCIFLPHYRIKYRTFPFPPKIEAAAGPHNLPHPDEDGLEDPAIPTADPGDTSGDQNGDNGLQSTDVSPRGPVDIVLDHILQHSKAEVAIACEEDVNYLVVATPRGCTFAQWLERQMPQIEVEDGVGTLSLKAAVIRERRAAIEHLMRRPSVEGEFYERPDPSGEEETDDGEGYEGPDEGAHKAHISCPTLQSIPAVGEGECRLWMHSGGPVILDWPHLVLKDYSSKTAIRCTSLSPGEELVLTGADDGFVRVWNIKTGRLVWKWYAQGAVVQCVAVSPTDAQAASGAGDGAVLLWDMDPLVANQGPHRLEGGHLTDVRLVAYSPDGEQLASASVDTTVNIWNPVSRVLLRTLRVHDAQPMYLAWPPDRDPIVASPDARWILWDAETGEQVVVMEGHSGAVWSTAVNNDSDGVVTEARRADIWEWQSGEELVHEHIGSTWDIVPSPNDKEVTTGSNDLSVMTNDLSTSEYPHIIATSSCPVRIVAYSRTRRYVALASEDGAVQLWNRQNREQLAEWRGHRGKCKSMAFINGDKDLLTSSEDGALHVWSVQDVLRLM